MRVIGAILLALLATSSCSSKKKSESKGEPTKVVQPPASDSAVGAAPAPGAGDVELASVDVAPAEFYPADKLDTFIDNVAFLGWSADNNLYTVQVRRGHNDAEMAGGGVAITNEVYDARTGRLVAMFRQSMAPDSKTSAAVKASWKAAKPVKEWHDYAKQGGFIKPAPSANHGSWKTTIKPVVNAVAKLSRLTGKTTATGAEIDWLVFPDEHDGDVDELLKATEEGKAEQGAYKMSPLLNLGIEGDGKTWQTLRLQIPYSVSDFEESQPAAKGTLSYYWSPKGDRFVIVAAWVADGMNEECDGARLQAFYARTAGPQIKVVGTDKGGARLRHVIERAGYAVTVEEIKADAPSANIQIYYRGADAKSIADKLAPLLGSLVPDADATVKELTKPGWIHLIVIGG